MIEAIDPADRPLFERWARSNNALVDLQNFRQNLLKVQTELVAQRRAQKQQGPFTPQERARYKRRFKSLQLSLHHFGQAFAQYRQEHHTICQNIGPAKLQLWQQLVPTSPLSSVGIKTIVITPQSPDGDYGRSGSSSS